ncbi:hypothetical protein V6N13_083456 [Hibiscus sabdariffa]|uniref:Uncharacterized protein n=1 Tax=Hibiscus sabdariffa TaxID=183260 RepID=A0ABR2SY31_9ROSI
MHQDLSNNLTANPKVNSRLLDATVRCSSEISKNSSSSSDYCASTQDIETELFTIKPKSLKKEHVWNPNLFRSKVERIQALEAKRQTPSRRNKENLKLVNNDPSDARISAKDSRVDQSTGASLETVVLEAKTTLEVCNLVAIHFLARKDKVQARLAEIEQENTNSC